MSDMERSLDAALHDARCGAQTGFAELWRLLSPTVHGFLRAKGSSDPEALTNEVFLGAFTGLPEFTGGGAQFRAFVFTIAQRRLVDEFRRRSRRPVEVVWDAELDDRHDESAEQRALSGYDDRAARDLLDDLPPDQRDVVMLRVFGDLTIDQIAEALGKTPGAVKALQRRGFDNLRRRVSPTTEAPADQPTGRRT